jgi:hypothetical protein
VNKLLRRSAVPTAKNAAATLGAMVINLLQHDGRVEKVTHRECLSSSFSSSSASGCFSWLNFWGW